MTLSLNTPKAIVAYNFKCFIIELSKKERWGQKMTYVQERILTIQLLEQMKKYPQLSKQLGLIDRSENKEFENKYNKHRKGE